MARRPRQSIAVSVATGIGNFPSEKRPEMRVTRDGTRSHMREKYAWSGAGTLHRPF